MTTNNLYTPTSNKVMLAGFPTKIQAIIRDPTLHGLVKLFSYMMKSSQKQYTSYSILNQGHMDMYLLYVALVLTMWGKVLPLVLIYKVLPK